AKAAVPLALVLLPKSKNNLRKIFKAQARGLTKAPHFFMLLWARDEARDGFRPRGQEGNFC
ncbi:hypothetical protein, partial [uncultured Acidaminococcus sp.]|uniref:hypothetical protein n=1 Tax=uncultured Acidaminococcus sp. TaxID=352152 RepID=UPI00260CD7C6